MMCQKSFYSHRREDLRNQKSKEDILDDIFGSGMKYKRWELLADCGQFDVLPDRSPTKGGFNLGIA